MKIKGRPARSLIAYPLSERRSVLQKFVTPKTGRLELAEFRTGTSARDIKDRMAWILDKQYVDSPHSHSLRLDVMSHQQLTDVYRLRRVQG
jgi:hypothetical protein